mmetsp:Transcript_24212/g.46925  ORF Transcript_24212/g.46925 Transcript_24212/m.46925 type:complete len:454 (+) Transcript_24212:143-1504(+)
MEPEVRAADERLRSWLRRAGRTTGSASKNYGATKVPGSEDEDAADLLGKQQVDEEETVARRVARRCRRVMCLLVSGAAIMLFLTMMIAGYVAISDSDEISFVTLGDWGCGPDNCRVPPSAPEGFHDGGGHQLSVAHHMAKAAAAISSKFVLALGDNFYWGGVDSPTDPLWKTVWLDRFNHESLQTPWYAILGNHDHYGNAEAQIDFSSKKLDCTHFKVCPSRWVLPRYWYSVVVPSDSKKFDVQFVFIDTVILAEGASQEAAKEKIKEGKLSKDYIAKWEKWAGQRKAMAKIQLEWFEHTLNSSTADWLIVAGHYPVFSGGEHGNTPELQQQILPLLQKYNVDAYLAGHDHTLQHLESGGVHYLVSGSGALKGEYHALPQSLFGSTENGFMTHRVRQDTMQVRMINDAGVAVNEFVLRRKRNKKTQGSALENDLSGEVDTLGKRVENKVFKIF